MMRRGFFLAMMCVFSAAILSGCGAKSYRFADADPVARQNDTKPVPVPKATDFETVAFGALPTSEGMRLLTHPDIPPLSADSAAHPFLDRPATAALIAAQNPSHPAPDPEAHYVVAGQQPALLTGPLYTFLKAVSAINLAASRLHAPMS